MLRVAGEKLAAGGGYVAEDAGARAGARILPAALGQTAQLLAARQHVVTTYPDGSELLG